MNRSELVDAVASTTRLARAEAERAVDAVFHAIVVSLKNGERVRITGFGSFDVRRRKAFDGRDPRTGEPLRIPASARPKFKAGKGLKDAVATE